jgi:hypothetical protein
MPSDAKTKNNAWRASARNAVKVSKSRPYLSRLDERGRQILIASGQKTASYGESNRQTLLARRLGPLSMANPIALVRILSTVVSLRCIQMLRSIAFGVGEDLGARPKS